MSDKKYLDIVKASETYLDKYGDTHLGVGWPKEERVYPRNKTMLEVMLPDWGKELTLLDFGCGLSHLLDHIRSADLKNIQYHGLDISKKYLEISRKKFPDINYYEIDVLEDDSQLPDFDYIIMNGIVNYKGKLSYEEMWEYFTTLVPLVYRHAKTGLAFNLHSKIVDWERDDLFHVPFDPLAEFLSENLTRHFTIRHDYRIYEYAVYLYR